jgi:hypothetical protein
MTQIRRTIVGATAALAIVLSSVTTAQADAAGKPNCLALPCPPPTNQRVAPSDASTVRGDAHRGGGSSGPNCATAPCPPPT